jgi:5'-nucleotidase / UDP-sugar diphosphatase
MFEPHRRHTTLPVIMRRGMRWLFVASVCVISMSLGHAQAQTTLTIVHTSEHHGTLEPLESGPHTGEGGMARRATLVQQVRKEVERVLVVDSGDVLVGTAMSAMFRGEADIAAMNLIGYDALAIGNHDLDFGLEHLQKLRRQAKFPFLCTNLKPRLPDVCQRVLMKTIGPLRVALIGLIGKRTYPDTINREALRDVTFQDPIEAARAVASEVREQVELFVAITHEDVAEDLALAAAVPALDVIIGGHTPGFDGLVRAGETKPEEGRVELVGTGAVYVKTHRQGRTLGRLDLLYHDRTIMSAEARNVGVGSQVPPDAAVTMLVQTYARRLNDEASRVIGKTLAELHGERALIRREQTNLGNFIADVARQQSRADVALINAGTVRGSIPAGPVTYRKLLEVLPFDASLTVVALTGDQLRAALEHAVSHLPEAAARFVQVSGLRYVIDPLAAVGSRVRTIEVNAEPFDPHKQYSVVITRFMADGGDGFEMFRNARPRRDEDTPLRDLIAAAFASGPVNPSPDSRIVKASGP